MNDIIIQFINGQKIATVCGADEAGNPYCFHCFYAFNAQAGLLYYKSSPEVYHTKLLLQRPLVAGTIQPDKLNTLAVQGIQFEGELLPQGHALTNGAASVYYKRMPYALALPGEIFTLRITRIKMTDNRRGFGKKLLWESGS